jgi:Ser/Thr protein kinase RdoA (MazF antagonist)
MVSAHSKPSEVPPSELGESQIASLTREHYGFVVLEQQRLGGELDQNVWLRTDGGEQYLLKVSRGHVDETLLWQETVLRHLAADAPDIPVPRLVRSRHSATFVDLQVAGEPHVARLLTWLPGTMLADLQSVPQDLLFEVGTIGGKITRSLGRLPAGSAGQPHHWDIRRSREAVDLALPAVREARERASVITLMEQFDAAVGRIPSLPTGVVHHDLNDFNILASTDGRGALGVSGVLDVNDALLTVRVAEVAIAAAYAMLRQENPLKAMCSVVAGFHSTVPLSGDELPVVFPFAAARLCVNATTWTQRTRRSPNPYGARRMRHTWPTLHRLAVIPPELAEARIRQACEAAPKSKTR